LLHLTAGVAAGLVLGAVGIGMLMLRRNRRCSNCKEDLVSIAAPDGLHTYEVMACTSCDVAEVLSNGTPNRFAFCPRCGRRGLETLADRLPDPPGQILVQVKEACQVCGYGDTRYVTYDREEGSKPTPPKGDVLPFRRD